MSSFFNAITKYLPFTSGRRLMGKDLVGKSTASFNHAILTGQRQQVLRVPESSRSAETYDPRVETDPSAGGRPRRVIKYRVMSQMNDYTSGKHRLPVQWTAWLSYTRQSAPTMAELQTDVSRKTRLDGLITDIEVREREERIRQGYISADHDQSLEVHSAVSGRSFNPLPQVPGSKPRIRNESSFVGQAPQIARQALPPPMETVADQPGQPIQEQAQEQEQEQVYAVPTPTNAAVPPPPSTVDPSKHSTKDDLRKLAEEDTKRRMKESAELPQPATPSRGVEGVGIGAGGLQPRRRGKAAA